MHLRPVPRRSIGELTYAEFLSDYVATGCPVILTDVGRTWPARTKWSLDYFAAHGDPAQPVRVVDGVGTYPERERTMPLGNALDIVRGLRPNPSGSPLYIRAWQPWDRHPDLLSDYTVPEFFDYDISPQLIGKGPHGCKWIFLGGAGTGTATHIDLGNSSAWMFTISGRKHWRFVTPAHVDRCRIGEEFVDLFEPDRSRFPEIDQVEGYEGIQDAGELMWNPSCIIHAVKNLEPSIGLTHNYIDLTNLLEMFTYEYLSTRTADRLGLSTDDILVIAARVCFTDLPKDVAARTLLIERLRRGIEARICVLRSGPSADAEPRIASLRELVQSLPA